MKYSHNMGNGDNECTIITNDGGMAYIYHNGENYITTYYQSHFCFFRDGDERIDEYADIEEAHSKQYMKDWPASVTSMGSDMIVDALDWLVSGESVEFTAFDKLVEEYNSVMLSPDLFDYFDSEVLPAEVREIIKDLSCDQGYEYCQEIIEKLNGVGYEADYGLDGQLIDLKPTGNDEYLDILQAIRKERSKAEVSDEIKTIIVKRTYTTEIIRDEENKEKFDEFVNAYRDGDESLLEELMISLGIEYKEMEQMHVSSEIQIE